MRLTVRRQPGRRTAMLALAALVVVACGATSATPRPELAWTRAEIELPSDVVDLAPGSTGGMICSPCHARQASLMTGIGATQDGLLAVGLQLPPSSAIAYRSQDGRAWTPEAGFPADEDTAALAVSADTDNQVVVGRRGSAGAAWVVRAGERSWNRAPDAESLEPLAGGATELRAVTTLRGLLVAAGSRDGDAGARSAATWTSADGLGWTLAPTGQPFDGAAAYGIAASGDRAVVVGETAGTAAPHGLAWTSGDGRSWTRIEASAFADGSPRAVAWTGTSFVAVGYAASDDRAMAWTSPDGESWTAQPSAPSLENHGKAIRMLGVAAGNGTLLGAGWKSDAGNGSGVVWTSADGVAWERLVDQVSMSGASLAGAAFLGTLPVVAGTSGYPDNDQASAWYREP